MILSIIIISAIMVGSVYDMKLRLIKAAADPEILLVTDPVLIETVELGEYPQTYVGTALNETLKTLGDDARTGKTYTSMQKENIVTWNEYLYNGNRYVKTTANLPNGNPMLSDGTVVTTGSIYFYKVEPIVFDMFRQGNQIIMVSHNGLGAVNFKGTTWKNAFLREFLNQNFLSEAGLNHFALSRKYYASTTASDTAGDVLTDKCWIPSNLEIQKFYTTNASRLKKGSDYARAGGMSECSQGSTCGYFYLRTVVDNSAIRKVNYKGEVYNGSITSTDAFIPCFILDLDANCFKHDNYAVSISNLIAGRYNYIYGYRWNLTLRELVELDVPDDRKYYLWGRNADGEDEYLNQCYDPNQKIWVVAETV